MKISAVIMCSGFGRRMGGNKLLMSVKGKRMFEYVLDTVYKIGFNKVIVVTPYEEIKAYSDNLGFVTAFNSQNDEGIAASVRIGASHCTDSDGIMYFTADQPLIDEETINKIVCEFKTANKITVPVSGGKNRNPVIFPIRYKMDLMSLCGDVGGKQVINSNKADIINVFFDNETPFLDIDTADDLNKL